MSNWKLNNFLALLGLLLLLFLTFFRENFLLAINATISGVEYDRAYFYWFSDFFKNISIKDLALWKWGLTIFFSIIMSLITLLSLYSWFQSKQLIKLTSLIYLGVFLFVVLLGGIGALLNNFDSVYIILRKILGVVQTPIPFFIFFTLFYKIK